MNIIEPFINSPDGMSLRADTNLFWSRDGPEDIKATKGVRDRFTRFMVSKTSGNQLVLRADTGKYFSLIGAQGWLQAAKDYEDVFCRFTVHDVGDGLIALQGAEGLFLSRDGEINIRAAKQGIDQHCKFTPGYGNLLDPKFEILDVTFGSTGDITYTPDAVDKTTFINEGSFPIQQTIEMVYSMTEIQTTEWNHAWSFGLSLSHTSGIENVASKEFSVTVGIGGGFGGSSSAETTTTFTRSVEVNAAVNKKTIVELITRRSHNTSIGFTATIKRTESDGTSRTFQEKGTWKGVMYSSAYINSAEEDLD